MLERKRVCGIAAIVALGASLPAGAVDPTPIPLDPRAGEGCWVRLFDEVNFERPLGRLAGGLYINSIAGPGKIGETSDREFLRNAGSLIVGPEAELVAYAEPGFRKEILTLEPRREVKDLREIGFPARIASLKIVCK